MSSLPCAILTPRLDLDNDVAMVTCPQFFRGSLQKRYKKNVSVARQRKLNPDTTTKKGFPPPLAGTSLVVRDNRGLVTPRSSAQVTSRQTATHQRETADLRRNTVNPSLSVSHHDVRDSGRRSRSSHRSLQYTDTELHTRSRSQASFRTGNNTEHVSLSDTKSLVDGRHFARRSLSSHRQLLPDRIPISRASSRSSCRYNGNSFSPERRIQGSLYTDNDRGRRVQTYRSMKPSSRVSSGVVDVGDLSSRQNRKLEVDRGGPSKPTDTASPGLRSARKRSKSVSSVKMKDEEPKNHIFQHVDEFNVMGQNEGLDRGPVETNTIYPLSSLDLRASTHEDIAKQPDSSREIEPNRFKHANKLRHSKSCGNLVNKLLSTHQTNSIVSEYFDDKYSVDSVENINPSSLMSTQITRTSTPNSTITVASSARSLARTGIKPSPWIVRRNYEAANHYSTGYGGTNNLWTMSTPGDVQPTDHTTSVECPAESILRPDSPHLTYHSSSASHCSSTESNTHPTTRCQQQLLYLTNTSTPLELHLTKLTGQNVDTVSHPGESGKYQRSIATDTSQDKNSTLPQGAFKPGKNNPANLAGLLFVGNRLMSRDLSLSRPISREILYHGRSLTNQQAGNISSHAKRSNTSDSLTECGSDESIRNSRPSQKQDRAIQVTLSTREDCQDVGDTCDLSLGPVSSIELTPHPARTGSSTSRPCCEGHISTSSEVESHDVSERSSRGARQDGSGCGGKMTENGSLSQEMLDYFWSYQGIGRQLLGMRTASSTAFPNTTNSTSLQSGEGKKDNQGKELRNCDVFPTFQCLPPISLLNPVEQSLAAHVLERLKSSLDPEKSHLPAEVFDYDGLKRENDLDIGRKENRDKENNMLGIEDSRNFDGLPYFHDKESEAGMGVGAKITGRRQRVQIVVTVPDHEKNV